MTNFIPIFPLDIIVYPGEKLNLHIFEARYKQLVEECIADKKMFGIPSVQDGRVAEFGTLMEVTELVKRHHNGELDIRTKGVKVFRVLETVKDIPDKLYAGAIVNYPDNVMEKDNTQIANLIVSEVQRLYTLLDVQDKTPVKADGSFNSYEIAHFIGLSKVQEYELLCLFNELQRLEYLRRHLNTITPVIKELEEVKARIQRNGHFRDLSLDDLNL